MNGTILILAGMLCFSGNHCVNLTHDTTAYLTSDWSFVYEKCTQEVYGCALLNKNAVVVYSGKSDVWTEATLFHELLHQEFWARDRDVGHPKALIERDNALRDALGVHDRYLLAG